MNEVFYIDVVKVKNVANVIRSEFKRVKFS